MEFTSHVRSEKIAPSFKIPMKCEQPMCVYAVLFDIRDAALSVSKHFWQQAHLTFLISVWF